MQKQMRHFVALILSSQKRTIQVENSVHTNQMNCEINKLIEGG